MPVADTPAATPAGEPSDIVTLWRGEIERAGKDVGPWERQAKAILDRYRLESERTTATGALSTAAKGRYNIFWSNVQTLAPAYYARPPKAVVQRRYLDRDPIGRIACRILERAVQYQIDAGSLHTAVKQAVLDRLTVGRGQIRVRYAPVFEPAPEQEDTGGEGETGDDGKPEQEEAQRIKWEMCEFDYIHWKDFRHEPGRVWDEASWVAFAAYMDRAALIDRFGDEVGELVPLTLGPDQQDGAQKTGRSDGTGTKARVWEVWNKAKKEVVWIADEFDQPLDQRPDPLELEGFFPCPRPLYATVTNDSLVPVPDYEQYKPQAAQMDDITGRIAKLIAACQAKGVYDADFPELPNLLRDGDDTNLFPVEDWAKFSQGNGFAGALAFLPVEIFSKVITELTQARADTKAEIYEISGVSDILRGNGDPNETATGVKTKGRFATLRLQDEQEKVAAFVRDLVRIAAEITCTLFQPETLAEMASCQEMEDLQMQVPAPDPMMGHNGGPPMGPPPGAAQPPMMPQRQPMGAGPGMMQ